MNKVRKEKLNRLRDVAKSASNYNIWIFFYEMQNSSPMTKNKLISQDHSANFIGSIFDNKLRTPLSFLFQTKNIKFFIQTLVI